MSGANEGVPVEQRVLRGLSTRGARLVLDSTGGYRLSRKGRTGPERYRPAIVAMLCDQEMIVETDGGDYVIAVAGRQALKRWLVETSGAAGHGENIATEMRVDETGARATVTVNLAESPLAWLRRRSGPDGRPLIDAAGFSAGERLRADYTRAQLMPRTTANWDAAVAGRRHGGGAGGITDLTESAISARRRVEKAVDAIGPELGGLLVDFCCFLKGLEDIERERRWPARSAKVVLRLALAALARHYGLATEAQGNTSRRIVHWGADDYRPNLG